MAKIRLNLIQKFICVFAAVLIPFFLLLGYMAQRLLEDELVKNADKAMKTLTTDEADDIDKYFKSLEGLGKRSAAYFEAKLSNERGIFSQKDFDRKYKFIDEALRTNVNAFEDKDISAIFLSNRSKLDDGIKQIIWDTEKFFDDYAKGVKGTVFNMYLITTSQLIRIYEKDWALQVEPDHDFTKDLFFYIADPLHDPERAPKWTPVYYDSIWKHWMTSLITPIYIKDRFFGVVGHDLVLDHIYEHVLTNKFFKSGYGFIFDSRKNLVIHPHHLKNLLEIKKMGEVLKFNQIKEKNLIEAMASTAVRDANGVVTCRFKENGREYLFYERKLAFLDWHFATVIPLDEVLEALPYFKYNFMRGAVFAVFLVFFAVVLIAWFYVVRPVSKFSEAANAIGEGDFDYKVAFHSEDELGLLASSLNSMSINLKKITASKNRLDREIEGRKIMESDLLRHSDLLEKLVAGRTSELEELNKELAQHQDHLEALVAERTKELEEANESLRKENTYRIFFETTSDAMLILDGDRFIDCNESAVKMFDCKNREALFRIRPSELSPETQPDGRNSLEKANELIIAAYEKGHMRFEWEHQRANGEVFPVEVLLTAMIIQGKKMLHVILRDIIERKRAESEVAEYRGHLEELVRERTKELDAANIRLQEQIQVHMRLENDISQILDASGDAIRVIDRQFNVIYLNDAFAKLQGGRKEDLVGGKCFDATPMDECHSVNCSLTRILNGEKNIDRDVIKNFSCDVKMPCMMTCVPYTDASGNVIGMVESCKDMTARKEAQRMSEENAQQQGRIEMSNNILHDIGNAVVGAGTLVVKPLLEKKWMECNSMHKLNEFLSEQKKGIVEALGGDKAEELLDFVDKLEHRMKERNSTTIEFWQKISGFIAHINSVLTLQRQYMKAGIPSRGVVNIASLLNNAVFMQEAALKKRGIEVRLDMSPELVSFPGDNTRLMQVMLNLLKNACEAFDECENQRNRWLKISAKVEEAPHKKMIIVFSDNAVGLAPDMKDKALERSCTTKEHGSGIGLSQCRSIINSHGGKIWIESDGVGKGSSVIIELPFDFSPGKSPK